MLSNVDNVERWSRRFAVGRVAVKKSGREYVRYNVSNESVQTDMKNVEQVHAGNKAAFEAVKVESVVRNGLVADVNLWEEQKRVNEDVEARAKAETRRYRAKLDNVMFLIGEMEARQEGMEKDFGKYNEEQAKQMVVLEGTIISEVEGLIKGGVGEVLAEGTEEMEENLKGLIFVDDQNESFEEAEVTARPATSYAPNSLSLFHISP